VEEAQPEVSINPSNIKQQARRWYSYDPRGTTRHDTAIVNDEYAADGLGVTQDTGIDLANVRMYLPNPLSQLL
jgi:hypothetical protein